MADRGWIESIVERVVGQVLESHTPQLRDEIVRRVTEETANAPAAESQNGTNSADLVRSVSEIQAGSTQREILRALLDNCARYASRVALFVVKGGNATGWQARGFSNNDRLKDFALDVNSSAVSRAINDQGAISARSEEIDSRFLQELGSPANGEAHLLPLLLKDKVAALVYADGGTEGRPHLDTGSLQLLVLATSAWLEVNSLRKHAQKGPAASDAEHVPTSTAPVAASVTSFNDPFASHMPSHAMAAAAAAESSAPAVAMAASDSAVAEPEVVEPEPPLQPASVESPHPPSAPATGSREDQEVHQKAQRFARLLIDEIKLYNQAKVAEGRKKKDLYDRLKEAIEKSRITYQKRYGNTVAASGDYFQHELVRSLAEDDISIMGTNFPR